MKAASPEEMKALARGWFDHVMNGRDVDAIDRLYAEDYRYSGPDGGVVEGREVAKRIARHLIDTMPDRVSVVKDQLVDGDRVATRWMSTGTPTDSLMGRPPNGRAVEVHGITISRIANGVIAEDWEIIKLVDRADEKH